MFHSSVSHSLKGYFFGRAITLEKMTQKRPRCTEKHIKMMCLEDTSDILNKISDRVVIGTMRNLDTFNKFLCSYIIGLSHLALHSHKMALQSNPTPVLSSISYSGAVISSSSCNVILSLGTRTSRSMSDLS